MTINCDRINNVFSRLLRFKDLFVIGDYFIQPHVIHMTTPEMSEDNPWHVHRTFEYSLLLSGEMVYFVEDQEILIEPGDAIVIPSDVRHRWKNLIAGSNIFGFMLYIFCQGDGAYQKIKLLRDKIICNNYHFKKFLSTESIIRQIIAEAENPKGYFDEKILCFSRETYVELLNIVAAERVNVNNVPVAPRMRGDDPNKIAEVIKYYINDNIHRPLRPSDICRHIGMSINYLNRLLKQHDGRSIGQIIIERKLFLACNLLDNSNRQIKDISSSLGMEDVDYFCRLFKKYKSLSPSEYRMRNRQ